MKLDRLTKAIIAAVLVLFANIELSGQSANFEKSSLELKASQRFRIETWDNATSLSSSAGAGSSYLRVRSRLSLGWKPARPIAFNLRLGNEFKYNFVPENKKFTLDEIFFDQLNLVWTDIGKSGIDLILGRQDMLFGEGFLVTDGGPLDGSRSAYFNAIRTLWKVDAEDQLNLFYCIQPAEDRSLPQFNSQDKKLVEAKEQGWGIYFSKIHDDYAFDIYQISKHITRPEARRSTHTVGLRTIAYPRGPIVFTGEFAYQLFDNELGCIAELEHKRVSKSGIPRRLAAGIVYLSGNEYVPQEGWDPMFARWPKWSESYIYTLILEGGVAYWTNLFFPRISSTFEFGGKLELQLQYQRLMAPAKPMYLDSIRGGGNVRGDLAIGQLFYKIDDRIKGHFLCEYFSPGNYYFTGADNYLWARMELSVDY